MQKSSYNTKTPIFYQLNGKSENGKSENGKNELTINGWMHWLTRGKKYNGNTTAFKAGKYEDSVVKKYGISYDKNKLGTITFLFREDLGQVLSANSRSGIGEGKKTKTVGKIVDANPSKIKQTVTITYSVK